MARQLLDLRKALTDYYHRVWKEEGSDDEAFAAALGQSPSLVEKLRNGRKNVTVEHIAQLAALQGVPVIAALGDIAGILGRQMGANRGEDAPGSTEGSAVSKELADEMRRSSGAARSRPRAIPKPTGEK